MAIPPTPPFLDDLVGRFASSMQPPVWLIDELQQRVVLFLNHVLMREDEARGRLARHDGAVVRVQWRGFTMEITATPAGLLDRAPATAAADLHLTLLQESPLELAQAALRGEKPGVRIEGDVQLAAEINWLVENVRWDAEEDLARVIGDAPAHALAQGASRILDAVRQFAASRAPSPGGGKSA